MIIKWIADFIAREKAKCRHPEKEFICGRTWNGWKCKTCGHERTNIDTPTIHDF